MQTKRSKKLLSFTLCITLIVAMALFTSGCNGSEANATGFDRGTQTEVQADINQLGEGSTAFPFTVVDQEDNKTEYEIHTDKETVGEALLELGLIDGDESEYGLFVKTVGGVTYDYDKDGVYWAFYINDEYAQTGVDATAITEGERYSFRVE